MPRPQKHVFVCSQQRPPGHPRGSCTEKGCREVLDEFYFQLQQRQCFTQVAVTSTGCIGPCGSGPTVLIYPESVMYGGVRKEDVAAIFEQHLLGDAPVARLQVPGDIW